MTSDQKMSVLTDNIVVSSSVIININIITDDNFCFRFIKLIYNVL
jgi:hypothetical protein